MAPTNGTVKPKAKTSKSAAVTQAQFEKLIAKQKETEKALAAANSKRGLSFLL
jgi:hypothetical protein